MISETDFILSGNNDIGTKKTGLNMDWSMFSAHTFNHIPTDC